MSEFSNQDWERLDQSALEPEYSQLVGSLAILLESSQQQIEDSFAGREDESVTIIATEGPKRQFARAVVPVSRDNALAEVRDSIASGARSNLRTQLAEAVTKIYSGETTTTSLAAKLFATVQSMHTDMFVAPDYRGPMDYEDRNPAMSILEFLSDRYDDSGRESEPTLASVTADEADEIAEVIPALLTFSEYKLARWHGNPKSLGSTLALVELIAAQQPKSILSVDIKPTMSHLILLNSAAKSDASRLSASYYTKEAAERHQQPYAELLESVARIQALQSKIRNTAN